jgi:drug/metabolite transporter (DMT)-like permease
MKTTIFLGMLLIVSAATFSQQTNPSPSLTKQDYLQKSKHQKTAAWWLLGGGLALSTTSVLIGALKATEDYTTIITGIFTGTDPTPQNNYTAATILFVVGTAAMVSSVFCFIASGKNKRKGMSLSFKTETIPPLQKGSFVFRSVPSLSLAIRL